MTAWIADVARTALKCERSDADQVRAGGTAQSVIGSFGVDVFHVGSNLAKNSNWDLSVSSEGSLQLASAPRNITFDTVNVLETLAATNLRIGKLEQNWKASITLKMTAMCDCYWINIPDRDGNKRCDKDYGEECYINACEQERYFINQIYTAYSKGGYWWVINHQSRMFQCCRPCFTGPLLNTV